MPQPRFAHYPSSIETPSPPALVPPKPNNPVVRGRLLVFLAWVVTRWAYLRNKLYLNAHFGDLRNLECLDTVTERWDPTVIPIQETQNESSQSELLDPQSIQTLPKGISGRYHSIAEYHALYLSGELTPLAVVDALLPLIRRDIGDKSHHSTAFIDSHPDAILKAARESTERYAAGKPLGILDGIPTAVKDGTNAAGYRSTNGRKMNEKHFKIADKSICPVRRWEEAGAIIMGKTNMHECGLDTTNLNPNWGTPRNPHNDQYFTGGSSGGSAYAVSAGLLPMALGTDGGGSIRLPASFCGIYGLKPSHGRLEDVQSSVTVCGPIAATISDLEIAYRVMAIPGASNPVCSLFETPRKAPTNRPKLLGVYQPWLESADPQVSDLITQVIKYYVEKLDYTIVEIDLPYLEQGQMAHAITILVESAARLRANCASKDDWLADITAPNKILLSVATQTPVLDFTLAQQMRNLLMQHLAFLYKKHLGLVIVSPTTPEVGWPIASPGDLTHGMSDGNKSVRNMEYLWLANFAGNPALSCPVGYREPAQGQGRIPVGIMGMGDWGAEDALLEWGRDAERWLTEGYEGGRARPQNWEDVLSVASERMIR